MSTRPKVLVIAYHFPPVQGSSGYLRTLKFVKYLPLSGFDPVVLTVHPRAYEASDSELLSQIPASVEVHRVFALNAKKHLSFRGSYPSFLALPDRMSSWIPAATLKALQLIRNDKAIKAIFSTYPISSAHAIGLLVRKFSGLPWVADFRDPMWDEYVATGNLELRARQFIERRSVANCSQALVTTQGMKDLYHRRYPSVAENRIRFLPNGYDEEDFAALQTETKLPDAPFTFLHAGLLDPIDRDPAPFLQAVARLIEKNPQRKNQIRIRFLAPGNPELVSKPVAQLGLQQVVSIEGTLPYAAALAQMASSHVLLLFQGKSCDHQIPAKLYEYLRIGRPIFALTTPHGETGRLVTASKAGQLADLESVDAIYTSLEAQCKALELGQSLAHPTQEAAQAFSRQHQAAELGRILATVTGGE